MNDELTSHLIRRFRGHTIPLQIFESTEAISFFKEAGRKLTGYKLYTYQWDAIHGSSIIHSVTPAQIDMFSLLSREERDLLRTDPTCFWIFDYSMEGTSYKYYNWFKNIHDSAKKHNIPFYKIFFISSNLYEEIGYTEWCVSEKITEQINIVILDYWSTWFIQDHFKLEFSIDQTVDYIKNNKNKYFLSLNRRCREYRILTTFLIQQSRVVDRGLISADKPNYDEINNVKYLCKRAIDENKFDNYLDKLPLILDRADFNVNWAWDNPSNLFSETMLSAVSETLIDDWHGTSLFYSEKSFKPMKYNHPILIFGQPSANHQLEHIGFKKYDQYFNLNFDSISDPIDRVTAQISELERVCDELDRMSINGKIDWLLQDRDTLLYNKSQLTEQKFNKGKLTKLIHTMEKYRDIS